MAQDKAAADKLKAAKAEAKRARRAASSERRKQMWQAFQMQRKQDKKLLKEMEAEDREQAGNSENMGAGE